MTDDFRTRWEERVIEAMARAICLEAMRDPDGIAWKADPNDDLRPKPCAAWELYAGAARAAFRGFQEASWVKSQDDLPAPNEWVLGWVPDFAIDTMEADEMPEYFQPLPLPPKAHP